MLLPLLSETTVEPVDPHVDLSFIFSPHCTHHTTCPPEAARRVQLGGKCYNLRGEKKTHLILTLLNVYSTRELPFQCF